MLLLPESGPKKDFRLTASLKPRPPQSFLTSNGTWPTWLSARGGLITSFKMDISHAKKSRLKIKKIMMGLRSPENCFGVFIFFYLFPWEFFLNGLMFTTALLATFSPGHSAVALPVGLLPPPYSQWYMGPCSRPGREPNAWKHRAIEPRYRPPGQARDSVSGTPRVESNHKSRTRARGWAGDLKNRRQDTPRKACFLHCCLQV